MEENLLDGNLNENEKRFLYQLDTFDLEKFYHCNECSLGAVCLITKNQIFLCDSYIKKNNKLACSEHYDTADEIYKVVYNREINYSVDENGQFICWQNQIVNDGNILIQLCSDMSSLLWVPESISEKQLDFLENFNKRIKNIVSKDMGYFEYYPIVFIQRGFEEDVEYTNSLDDLIEKLKNNKRR